MPTLSLPKLKIVHQGLLLITVPLLFGFASIVILQSLMQTYRHIRNESLQAQKFATCIYDFNSALLQLNLFTSQTNSNDKIDNGDKRIGAIDSQLQKLQALVAAPPNNRTFLSPPAQPSHSASADANLAKIVREWGTLKSNLQNGAKLSTIAEEQRNVLDDSNNMLRDELHWNADEVKGAKAADQATQRSICAALVANILACTLLAFYFSQSLVKRLQVLTENSDRFANGRELLPELGGDDEIAKVDTVFRNMVKTAHEAEQAQRDFVATINHDIRTPLNSLQATLSMISSGVYGTLSEQGMKRVSVAEQVADDLIGLINQLLDIEKAISGKLELKVAPASFRGVCEKAMQTLDGFARFKDVRIEMQEVDITLLADETRITQVMINLLGNAIKFAPAGSTIKIQAKQLDNNQAQIEVCDQGAGIPSGMESKIFDRFAQIPEQGSAASEIAGSGLGLSICKQIIDAHNGAIGVNSGSGCGSIFWVRLKCLPN